MNVHRFIGKAFSAMIAGLFTGYNLTAIFLDGYDDGHAITILLAVILLNFIDYKDEQAAKEEIY